MSKGKGIPVPEAELTSLPPRPSETPTEAVSQGALSGQARHAGASDNLRDSPLMVDPTGGQIDFLGRDFRVKQSTPCNTWGFVDMKTTNKHAKT